jgi:stage IV sporulation protein FB
MARARPTPGLSFRIARLAGIEVRLHLTTVLLFGWILLVSARSGGWRAVAEGGALVGCVFASIVLHELGHALVARRYGIGTRDITLWPVGGVATLERIPERPREELAVALAGPAVNVVIAGVLFAALVAGQWAFDPRVVSLVGGPFVARVLALNLLMAGFNLLPAFPMDGGRVLRALLATRRSRVAATVLAARVGRVLAVGLAVAGVFFSPSLVLVAIFVWLAGQQEAAAVQLTQRLATLRVADAMVSRVETLEARTPIARAVDLSITGFQHDFPVREGEQLLGVLSRDELLDALEASGADTPVASALHGPTTTVAPHTSLTEAISLMRAHGTRAALVIDHGRLAGLLTAENVAERLVLTGAPA